MGVVTRSAVRAKVHRDYGGEPLFFGLATEGYNSAYPDFLNATDLIATSIHRTLRRGSGGGQPGSAMLVIPGHAHPHLGTPWDEMIKPRDVVEIDTTVIRYPDLEGSDSMSSPWETRFFGFVESISRDVIEQDGAFVEVVYLQVTDNMGVLSTSHYNYWRNLGATLQGTQSGGLFDKLASIDRAGFDRIDLYSSTIAQAAEIVFEAFIYGRLALKRTLYIASSGSNGPFDPRFYQKRELAWEDMHGYRFESDNFQITVDLAQLAPQAQSWMEMVSTAVDAPTFYEFYVDNLSRDQVGNRSLKNGGTDDLGRSIQLKSKKPDLVLRGDRVECFCIRPVPFPIYDPEQGGYSSTAWDSLDVRHVAPTGALSIKTTVSAQSVYSVFSVDPTTTAFPTTSNASQASTQAQLVVDVERFAKRVGYRGLDLQSKRQNIYRSGGSTTSQSISMPELARRLSWQNFSFNHFNDIFKEGTIRIPLDLKMQLGIRFVCEGYMYYVEEYTHSFDANGCDTTLEVSHGLRLARYGYHGDKLRELGLATEVPAWTELSEDLDYYEKYLGRKRPGEEFEPLAGAEVLASQVGKTGTARP